MYACAADDEKVMRILAAPRTFVQSLANITGVASDDSHIAASMPAGASLPALGLSNKPTYDSAAAAAVPVDAQQQQQQQLLLAAAAAAGDDDDDDGCVFDDGSGQLQPTVMSSPPLEDALSQVTHKFLFCNNRFKHSRNFLYCKNCFKHSRNARCR